VVEKLGIIILKARSGNRENTDLKTKPTTEARRTAMIGRSFCFARTRRTHFYGWQTLFLSCKLFSHRVWFLSGIRHRCDTHHRNLQDLAAQCCM